MIVLEKVSCGESLFSPNFFTKVTFIPQRKGKKSDKNLKILPFGGKMTEKELFAQGCILHFFLHLHEKVNG